MVEHPAARALTGFLLVRGGVHQVAYARAVEKLTGADLSKMFPAPRIPTEEDPGVQPHIKRGDHRRLDRFSPSDYLELAAVFKGPHPETEEELEVVDDPPEGGRHTICPRSRPSSRRTTRPTRSPRSREAPRAGRSAEAADGRSRQRKLLGGRKAQAAQLHIQSEGNREAVDLEAGAREYVAPGILLGCNPGKWRDPRPAQASASRHASQAVSIEFANPLLVRCNCGETEGSGR